MSIRAMARWICARIRRSGMAKAPPVEEREFLRLTANHGEYRRKLELLGQKLAADDIAENAAHVALTWVGLAIEHLEDARSSLASARQRSTYSRAYYGAYNASKAVRYIASGMVSLAGDDHKKAIDLPDDFPDVVKWADEIGQLYQHRLRADYDNFTDTAGENVLEPAAAVASAEGFVAEALGYLKSKYGIEP